MEDSGTVEVLLLLFGDLALVALSGGVGVALNWVLMSISFELRPRYQR